MQMSECTCGHLCRPVPSSLKLAHPFGNSQSHIIQLHLAGVDCYAGLGMPFGLLTRIRLKPRQDSDMRNPPRNRTDLQSLTLCSDAWSGGRGQKIAHG